MQQAYKTLYEWFGIIAERVGANNKKPGNARVYIAMVETANNRLKKSPNYFPNIGLVIIDECHLGNFTKIMPCYVESFICGYTATAKTASKKHPLKEFYETIIVGPQIEELIKLGNLTPNKTYRAIGVDRDDLAVRAGEFDTEQMSALYSKTKHVKNTVEGYEKHCKGTKTLVFNCSVEHSKLVDAAFREAGYNSRHIDGNEKPEKRAAILEWFKNTPDAILNNIGILTTGFDEPSVLSVIVNKATLSLPLWLQMCGRGSRTFPGKLFFTIVDMGGNTKAHLDWCDYRDWEWEFNNPGKPKLTGGGIGAVTECVECGAYIPASTRVCKFCDADQPAPIQTYDSKMVEFELITKAIDVPAVIVATQDHNPYYALHQIKENIVSGARSKLVNIDDAAAYRLLESYQEKVAEWCKVTGKNYNQWHKSTTGTWFLEELDKVFGWKPPALSIAI
jgi:hypothetical protein